MNKVIRFSIMAGACALCVLLPASTAHADELLELCDSETSLYYNSGSIYGANEDVLLDDCGSFDDILAEGQLLEEPLNEDILYDYGLPYEEDMLDLGLIDNSRGNRQDDILIEEPGSNVSKGNNPKNKTTDPVISDPGSGNIGGNTGNKGSSTPGITSEMSRALDAINAKRANAGVRKLTFSTALNKAADARVKEITVKFSHIRPNGKTNVSILREFGIDYTSAGENIACCVNNPEDLAAAWASSTTHNRCMLNKDYGHAGIGVTTVGGVTYWVLLLTD